MKTELWILRHGETEWNVAERLQGSLDSPLTARGKKQCLAASTALRNVEIDAVYASPLGRAQSTARIVIADRPLQLSLDPRLSEIAYGVLEGLTWEEIEERHPEISANLRERSPTYAPPGGESRLTLQTRIVEAMSAIALAHPSGRILVISHGGALSAFHKHVLGLPLESASPSRAQNCAIHRFTFAMDRFELVSWNVCDHLPSE